MSWCNENGIAIEDPSGGFIPFKERRQLHRSLVRYLYKMGWSQLEIGDFFGRTEAWASQVYGETEKQLPGRIARGR